MRVERVEVSEVPGVYSIKLEGLEGSEIRRLTVELPKQVQVFKEGALVETEASTKPIPWGGDADLYLSSRVFAAKGEEAEISFYLSAGGLQLRLMVKEGALNVKPMDKVYVAFKIQG